ncbi:hypothetical protein F8568_011960 [Actinomadura sp. LD22]|uniref:Uncharacterized protein n=1 Tax=Actinomadura physcomitrii TaxID=2650748 RepID=A0A6I4M7V6_9ACTN|nr:hypothetical protein [Actinomadura physcomitrii]MWA01080.1 hypothetical protein [Actinomadura physcomitrii]
MSKKNFRAGLSALTGIYGLTIAVLAMLDVSSLGLIAAIGAVLLGMGWAFSGRFAGRGA